MPPTPKKAKREIPDKEVLLRLCDAFIRTDGNIICPIIKAETSIRVLYKLQKDLLIAALTEVGQETDLIYKDIQFKSSSSKEIEGNIFITCLSCESCVGEEKRNEYKAVLLSKLLSKKISVVKHILIDAVQDTSDIIPQPLISERDFEMHKLLLCSTRISEMSAESMERADLFIAAENIKSELEELKDHYTRFAVLSQNGKGKSFILNLLMLMTSDNKEEYRKNNENLKMPQDMPQNTPLKSFEESDLLCLPDVVRTGQGLQVTSLDRPLLHHGAPLAKDLSNASFNFPFLAPGAKKRKNESMVENCASNVSLFDNRRIAQN